MQISPIQNTNFTGKFVRNEDWNAINSALSRNILRLSTASHGLETFEPYIDLIEQHCPETSVYKFEAFQPESLSSAQKFQPRMFRFLRNGEQIGSSEKIVDFDSLVDSVKDYIVRDAVGKF